VGVGNGEPDREGAVIAAALAETEQGEVSTTGDGRMVEKDERYGQSSRAAFHHAIMRVSPLVS
jgi:hypothetical protein